jgi:uncharacterized protein (DUF302 family)
MIIPVVFLCFHGALAQSRGVVTIPSRYSVAESAERLVSLAGEKGMTIFARIDFAGDARSVGLELRPAQLVIFGNPLAGTPLIVASPTTALDLPLKALAWEDAEGNVRISYNDPSYIGERHDLPDELVRNIRGIEALLRKVAE